MIKKPMTVRSASGSTIDVFKASETPSLVGFWKCDEGAGLFIKDYSQYGNDLTLGFSGYGFANAAEAWAATPGYYSCKNDDAASITGITGGPLDTGSNYVVIACELINVNGLSDCDMGTAWDVVESSTGGYRGICVSTLGGVIVLRASFYDVGLGAPGHDDLVYVQAGTGGYTLNANHVLAGAFYPGTFVKASIDGSTLFSSATTYDTLEVQKNTFALSSARNAGFETITGLTAVRNYQIWSFATEPPNLDVTLKWMSASPGKLPPWWEGL